MGVDASVRAAAQHYLLVSTWVKRLSIILGSFAYLVALHLSYVYVISPLFSYHGYTYHPPSTFYIAVAWLMALTPSLWMPVQRDRPSQVVYWLLYVLVFIPAMIIPFYTLYNEPTRSMSMQLVLLGCFAMLGGIYRLPLLILPRLKISSALFWSLVALLSLGFYTYIVKVFGVHFNIVSMDDVYGVRAEYDQQLADSGVGVAYALEWQSNVINPLLIAYGLVNRKGSLVALGLIGQLFLYSITGFKSVFLSAEFILMLLVVQIRKGTWFGQLTAWGFGVTVMLCAWLDVLTSSIFYTSIFVRRMIITPGLLTGYYFDFFSNHPRLLLAHSIFKGLFTYPYSLSPPNLIGSFYWGDAGTAANANLWADAYANFGLWGMFFFTLMLGLVLLVFDSLSVGRNPLVTSLLLGVPAITLANTALLTSLFNHGIGLATLFVFLMPREQESEQPMQQEMIRQKEAWE